MKGKDAECVIRDQERQVEENWMKEESGVEPARK